MCRLNAPRRSRSHLFSFPLFPLSLFLSHSFSFARTLATTSNYFILPFVHGRCPTSPRCIPPALCRIPLAFGSTTSHALARIQISLSLSLSLCFSRSSSFSFTFVPAAALFLFPELIVALSPSGGYRHPFRAPFALLHRSRATPNYPDVTGAGRRLLRANSRDFGKFIGPRSGKLAAERPQGRTRISAYELPIPPVRGGTPSFNFSRRYYDIHFSVYPR